MTARYRALAVGLLVAVSLSACGTTKGDQAVAGSSTSEPGGSTPHFTTESRANVERVARGLADELAQVLRPGEEWTSFVAGSPGAFAPVACYDSSGKLTNFVSVPYETRIKLKAADGQHEADALFDTADAFLRSKGFKSDRASATGGLFGSLSATRGDGYVATLQIATSTRNIVVGVDTPCVRDPDSTSATAQDS